MKSNKKEIKKLLSDFNDPAARMKLVAGKKPKKAKPGLRKLPPTVSMIGGKGTFRFPGPRIG